MICFLSNSATAQKLDAPYIYMNYLENGAVKISWKAVEDADKYVVYRRELCDEGYTKIATIDATNCKYVDTTARTGRQYYYRVKSAREKAGKLSFSGYSNKRVVRISGEPISSASIYTGGGGNLSVRWGRVDGCDKYYLYRQKEGEKSWELLEKINQTRDAYNDFDVEPGVKYRYRLRTAIGNSYGDTLSSSYITLWQENQPETPVVTMLDEDGNMDWAWQKGASKYDVYKSTDKVDWQYIATVWESKYKIVEPELNTYYTIRAYYAKENVFSNYACGLEYGREQYQKKILFDGDSITFGIVQNEKQGRTPYPKRVGEVLNCETTNISECGKSIAAASHKKGYNISEQVEKGWIDYTGYDIICIANGATDYNFNVPLGAEDSMDINTFYGAYNYVITEIRRQNPNAEIVLITPIYRVYRRGTGADYGMYFPNHIGYTQMDYCHAILRIAELKGCYAYDSTLMNIVNENNIMTATVDGLHPTQEYYVKIGDSLATYIEENILK